MKLAKSQPNEIQHIKNFLKECGWLKDELKNIQLIFFTLEIFHLLMFLLKGEFSNIQLILVTLETSHELISWLKDEP